jgi:hypothetical protein
MKYCGVNIQYPISESIVLGKKTIETRTYPLPNKYLNTEMLLVETPGATGNFRARIVAIIKFTACIAYANKHQFYKDVSKHLVSPDSVWAWTDKPKFGWKVELVRAIDPPKIVRKRKGIVFTTNLVL